MKNHGFKTPVIEASHYILGQGNVPLKVLQPKGDWTDCLPLAEKQAAINFDTFNCTGFGSTSQIEMYMLKRFGVKFNFSDRWVGIIAGTSPQTGGNDPQTVYEAIRKYGLIPEEMLPFNDDIRSAEEYFSFKGANEEACYKAGREWLEKWDFKHEWVFNPDMMMTLEDRIHDMKLALKYSPLAIAVYAWQQDGRGVYVDIGGPNHWTSQYAFDDFQSIFDSYEPFEKKAEQKIIYCKRISIEAKTVEPSSPGTTDIGSAIINFFKKLWQKMFRKQ